MLQPARYTEIIQLLIQPTQGGEAEPLNCTANRPKKVKFTACLDLVKIQEPHMLITHLFSRPDQGLIEPLLLHTTQGFEGSFPPADALHQLFGMVNGVGQALCCQNQVEAVESLRAQYLQGKENGVCTACDSCEDRCMCTYGVHDVPVPVIQ